MEQPALSEIKIWFWTPRRAVSQEWNLRYADWNFDMRLWAERCDKRRSTITRWVRRRFTKADLNSFGKVPVLRDKFTIRVTIGTILSIHWGKKLNGIGSN